MAYNKKAGQAVRAAGVPHSRRNKSQHDSSPLHWSWSGVLDNVSTGLTAAGMVPGLGNVADLANVALSGGRAAYAKATGDEAGFKEHGANMAINAAAAIPGAGLAVGGAKLAKAGIAAAKGAKTIDKAADAAKLIKKGTQAKTKAKGALDATKSLAAKSKDYVKKSVSDAGDVFKGKGKGFKEYYGGDAAASVGKAVKKATTKKGVKKVEKKVASSYTKGEDKPSDKIKKQPKSQMA